MKTGFSRIRRGCSPWALLGCGCGLLAMIGIVLVFLSLGILTLLGKTDARWNLRAYDQCQQHLLKLNSALEIYKTDYGALPPSLDALKEYYVDDPGWLHCPLEEGRAPYRYTPQPARPTDPLITCDNHGQGPLVLLHNGRLRLPDTKPRKSK